MVDNKQPTDCPLADITCVMSATQSGQCVCSVVTPMVKTAHRSRMVNCARLTRAGLRPHVQSSTSRSAVVQHSTARRVLVQVTATGQWDAATRQLPATGPMPGGDKALA